MRQTLDCEIHRDMIAVIVLGREVEIDIPSPFQLLCQTSIITSKQLIETISHPFDLICRPIFDRAKISHQ